MDIESRIRSRIEAILLHDAKQSAELRDMASADEPSVVDPLAEERTLFGRIIASYRSAVAEVNGLLEENVEFLSAFCRIVETTKDKVNLDEICLDIAHCALDDFGSEYCGIVFYRGLGHDEEPFRLEGIRDGHEFLRIHGGRNLLGSARFFEVVASLAQQGRGSLNIPDVYRDARFQAVDWPSVVRSLVCVPVTCKGEGLGALLLGHSTPSYFHESHLRMLRILAAMIAHVRLLTSAAKDGPIVQSEVPPDRVGEPDTLSVVLIHVESPEHCARAMPLEVKTLREIRSMFAGSLQGRESILQHRENELLLLLPGVNSDLLSSRVRNLRQVFRAWKAAHPGPAGAAARLNIGFATCGAGDDLSRVLEAASAVMHPDAEDELQEQPAVVQP